MSLLNDWTLRSKHNELPSGATLKILVFWSEGQRASGETQAISWRSICPWPVCGRKGSLDYFDFLISAVHFPLHCFLHFVLLVWQTGCATLPWSIGAVGCVRHCVVRQKLLESFCKQSGNVHEWMRQRKSKSLLFPSPEVQQLSGLSFLIQHHQKWEQLLQLCWWECVCPF